ncbi:MAG: Mur ligase [Deltaproteobacteria bacterium]|nr:Mur ligase [Deltaproteobacteria bacterium]MBP7286617.1 hypothetical protein [Nannocystaceae bacterium]
MQPPESRRLTGPSLYARVPGAAAELALAPGESFDELHARWLAVLRPMLARLGWARARCFARPYADGTGGALGFTADDDVLYAACDVNDWALATAAGLPAAPEAIAAAQLAAAITAERRPDVLALLDAAATRGLPGFFDDDGVTIGLGVRGRTWPLDAVPQVDAVPWSQLGRIPVVAITGTNGKTTSARLLARMFREAGRSVGNTSTDGIVVDGVMIEEGDCTGPGAARRLLRHPTLEVAVLESARGGLLRRGFVLPWCDAALLTNVSDDHLGEWGISTVDELAEAKAVIGAIVPPHGHAIVGADSAPLVRVAERFVAKVVWFSLHADAPTVLTHLRSGGEAWYFHDGALVHAVGETRERWLAADAIAIGLHGAAGYNLANAAGAAATAHALGVPRDAIVGGLERFDRDGHDNPGRLERHEKDGVLYLLDFAHNKDGLRQQRDVVAALRRDRGGRLAVSFGMAGDRSDEALRALGHEIAAMQPNHVVLHDKPDYLRGRTPGEVPAILQQGLLEAGIAADAIEHAADERAAIACARAWARAGDMVAVFAHTERTAVV